MTGTQSIVTDNMTITGTLESTGTMNVQFSGNWNATGGYFMTTGTITANGAGDQTITSDGNAFYHFEIDNSGAAGTDDVVLADAFDVNGSLSIVDGELDPNTNDINITVAGNWVMGTSGSFNAGAETVTFDGITGTSTVTTSNDYFANVVINDGDGGSQLVVQMAGTLGMTGNLTITNGALNLDGYEADIFGNVDIDDELDASSGTDGNSTIVTGGNWDMTGGIFTSTDSSVMFVGTTAALTITSNGRSFNDLIINGTVGLVGYWKLDESSGAVSNDYSGYGNHGNYNSAPAPSTDVTGTLQFTNPRSLLFDGVDDFVSVPKTDELNITRSMTVSAWFKLTGAATEFDAVVHTATNSAWLEGYGIYVTDNPFVGSVNALAFYVSNWEGTAGLGGVGYINFDWTVASEWNHVVGVYDGANVSIYLNGVKGTDDVYAGAVTTTSNVVHIGKGEDSGGTLNQYTIPANIDDVRIYNRGIV